MIKNVFILTCCSISLVACAKTAPVLKHHENLIGTWTNPNSELIISENGYVSYQTSLKTEKKTDNLQEQSQIASNIQAPIVDITYNEIKLGNGIFKTSFNLNKAPYQTNGAWHLTLNDQDYIKRK